MRLIVSMTAACLSIAFTAAHAQSGPAANPLANMTRFAGTVTSISGTNLKVSTADAGSVDLRLTPSTTIMQRLPATMADIRSTSFIGCTAVKQADGSMVASECHIFPESMRGLGEGHNPMGPPATTMTNGNVATMTNGSVQGTAGATGGTVLSVTYKGGSQDIRVTPQTEITQVMRVEASALQPGTRVMGGARQAADGAAEAVLLNVVTPSTVSSTSASAASATVSSVEMPGKEFKDGYVEVGGFRLHYREAGPRNAPVIISLPGSAGLEMSRAKDHLIRDYRVIEINPPGWGDDPELKREMNQDEIGKLLGEAANKLVKSKYYVLGTSMGGANALWLASQFPKRVKAIVLEGSMAPARLSDLHGQMIYRENVRKMLANAPAGGAAYPTPPADPAKPWATAAYNGKQMAQRFRMMQWVQADLGSSELFASVRKSGIPILAMVGDRDAILKPTIDSYYREVLPAAKFKLVAGGGHDLQNTQTDAFVQAVASFLGQHK
jgi:pimeloyl-ACP methyl ester carboxylesterase